MYLSQELLSEATVTGSTTVIDPRWGNVVVQSNYREVHPVLRLERHGSNRSHEELEKFFLGKFVTSVKKVPIGSEAYFVRRKLFRWVGKGKNRRREPYYSTEMRFKKVFVDRFVRRKIYTNIKLVAIDPGSTPGYYMKPNRLSYFKYQNVKFPNVTNHYIYDWNSQNGSVDPNYVSFLTCVGPFRGFDQNPNANCEGDLFRTVPIAYASEPNNPLHPHLREKALTKLYNKVIDAVPNYGEAYGEAFETYETIHKIIFEGIGIIKDIVTLNKKRIAGRLRGISAKDISEIWLTWVYGIAPLISDIQGTLDLIENSNRVWRSYSASVGEESRVPESGTTGYGGSSWEGFTTTRSFHRYGVIIEGRLDFSEFRRRSLHWESTAANVYELIPFSFMLDWIIDLSSSLHAAHLFDSLQYSAWETYGTFVTTDVHVKGNTGTHRLEVTGENRQVISRDSVDRFVLSTIPDFPPPHLIDLADLPGVLSVNRAINIAAILIASS